MRIPGRAALTACTLALAAVLLAACTPTHSDADPTKTPKPTPTPVFTSDADALAAATKVYTQFVRVSDEIDHDGGANPERITPYVNAAGLKHEIEAANELASEHARGYGFTTINNVILQSHEEADGVATVAIYACQDLTNVDLRDANGVSLVDDDRADFVAYVAELKSDSTGRLVVQSNKYWPGGGICKH